MMKAVPTRTVLASMIAETMKRIGQKKSMKTLTPTMMRLKVVTEDINASIDKVVIDELTSEDEESVASSISLL